MAKRKKKMDNALFAMVRPPTAPLGANGLDQAECVMQVDAREQRGLARRFNITCASKCELLLFKHGEETQRIKVCCSSPRRHLLCAGWLSALGRRN